MRRLVGDEVWSDLLEQSYPRRHSVGDTLLRQGDPGTHVLALCAGVVKVTRREQSGDLALLAFRGPGELLGEVAVLDDDVRSASIEAISHCSVAVLSKKDFLRFVTERDLFPVLVRYALARLRESDRARGGGDPAARLAASLVSLADISGRSATAPGQRLELALTREELAQHLRVSRNTVTACLSELDHVRTGRMRVFIDDLPALRRAAVKLDG
ncbi:Crp/Fnr family transcriptional regulator [Streptomyces sp. P38-E01]|uniref:Crp/Fnr family transcriptional regulator n=1 Tax=Streptomyces tardus TaxID=2780544 RepID=A0A949N7Y0_9ACTN|nr:Crp/Fnr family transcriptional regulator [Streptomyces tardus]